MQYLFSRVLNDSTNFYKWQRTTYEGCHNKAHDTRLVDNVICRIEDAEGCKIQLHLYTQSRCMAVEEYLRLFLTKALEAEEE